MWGGKGVAAAGETTGRPLRTSPLSTWPRGTAVGGVAAAAAVETTGRPLRTLPPWTRLRGTAVGDVAAGELADGEEGVAAAGKTTGRLLRASPLWTWPRRTAVGDVAATAAVETPRGPLRTLLPWRRLCGTTAREVAADEAAVGGKGVAAADDRVGRPWGMSLRPLQCRPGDGR